MCHSCVSSNLDNITLYLLDCSLRRESSLIRLTGYRCLTLLSISERMP